MTIRLGDETNVRLVDDKLKHRVLLANQLIEAGTIVFDHEPLAMARIPSNFCSGCARDHAGFGINLSRCSNCKSVYYCSKECQVNDFRVHKFLCEHKKAGTRALGDRGDSCDDDEHDLEMLVKTCINIASNAPNPESIEVFKSLVGHVEVWSPQEVVKNNRIAEKAFQLLQRKWKKKSGAASLPDIESLKQHLGRFSCNNFVLTNDELFGRGEGTYPFGALLNHSCTPNCVMRYEGKRQLVVAIKDIQPEEELTNAYVDAMMPREERLGRLQRKYNFICCCSRCKGIPGNNCVNDGFSLLDQFTGMAGKHPGWLNRSDWLAEQCVISNYQSIFGEELDEFDGEEEDQVLVKPPLLPTFESLCKFSTFILKTLLNNLDSGGDADEDIEYFGDIEFLSRKIDDMDERRSR